MKIIVARTLTILFFTLAFIHFYWALGGAWGAANVIPTNAQGMAVLQPSVFDTIMVGIGLALFGLYYMALPSQKISLPSWVRKLGMWLIPLVFLVRAVGDLKYVGFFKQIEGTAFAYWDTLFFTPLCLIIGLMGLLLIMMRK